LNILKSKQHLFSHRPSAKFSSFQTTMAIFRNLENVVDRRCSTLLSIK